MRHGRLSFGTLLALVETFPDLSDPHLRMVRRCAEDILLWKREHQSVAIGAEALGLAMLLDAAPPVARSDTIDQA
eukprot:CAMPEP_0174870566 /NCGR_PEP_ID=MMETSP1114-20130205/69917_1 /TAXON_ID=312471 /ORGANISM="Neobodo designis, Strain CCAP 1951/1" /LENGTH=74 /DNA_ID=CAMNT_0016105833 /DNA_START=1 /DNA_END=221 /DNA_ORIENTATION=+